MKKAISFAIAAALGVGIIAGSASVSMADSTYVVKKGDCLWNIAKVHLGAGEKYPEIVKANPSIKNPNKIYPGQEIIIPGGAPAPAPVVNETPAELPQEVILDEGSDKGPANEPPLTVSNPVKTYETLDAMNEAAGTILQHPGVMGVTDEKFAVIDDGKDKIAQYTFAINGVEYVLRNCPTSNKDISGVYVDGHTAFADREIQNGIDFITAGGKRLARWARVEGQFILSAAEDAVTEEIFEAAAEDIEMVNAIQGEN